jgi:uncharacterized membrane protein YkvA (DUF1232 family)
VRTLFVIVVVTLVIWASVVGVLLISGRRVAARQLARLLPDLAALLRGLMRDPRVPRGSKVLLAIAVVWIVSPIDLLPEFLPVIGPLDDVIVVALVLRHVVKRAGPEVVAEHWRGDPGTLALVMRALRVSDPA